MNELWKHITTKPYQKSYKISNLGRVRSVSRVYLDSRGRTIHRSGKLLKIKNKRDHEYVTLCNHDKCRMFPLYRLVAEAFVPNPHHYHFIKHLNHKKSDNRAKNLQWYNPIRHFPNIDTYKNQREVWRYVPKLPHIFQVSSLGRVRNLDRVIKHIYYPGGIYQPDADKYGDESVYLRDNGNSKRYMIQRLVALTFVPNPHHYPISYHKNENIKDNRASNIGWCTPEFRHNYRHYRNHLRESHSLKDGRHIILTKDNQIHKFPSVMEAARWIKNKGISLRVQKIRDILRACCKSKNRTILGYKAHYSKDSRTN